MANVLLLAASSPHDLLPIVLPAWQGSRTLTP